MRLDLHLLYATAPPVWWSIASISSPSSISSCTTKIEMSWNRNIVNSYLIIDRFIWTREDTRIFTDLIWSLLCSKATSIKQKSNGVQIHRLSVTVSIHELFQLGASLNPEENFIPILQHQRSELINNLYFTNLVLTYCNNNALNQSYHLKNVSLLALTLLVFSHLMMFFCII